LEISLPDGWDEGDLLQLFYRTPGNCLLEVKVLEMGGSAIVHWGSGGSGAIQSVEVATGDYVTPEAQGTAAFKRDRLQELIDKFSAGLESTVQVIFADALLDLVHMEQLLS
jgi:hypothetical protein